MFIGIAIIIIGLVFLLQNMGFISTSAWQIIWPALIIMLGVSVMMKRNGCCGWGKMEKRD